MIIYWQEGFGECGCKVFISESLSTIFFPGIEAFCHPYETKPSTSYHRRCPRILISSIRLSWTWRLFCTLECRFFFFFAGGRPEHFINHEKVWWCCSEENCWCPFTPSRVASFQNAILTFFLVHVKIWDVFALQLLSSQRNVGSVPCDSCWSLWF